jgi:hypothetical protein
MRLAGQAQYRRSRLNSNVRLRREAMRGDLRASCTLRSCRRPSTRVHCARPGVNVRAVLGHSGGRSTIASLPTETAEDKVADIGQKHRPRRPPALKLLAAFASTCQLSCAHDGRRRGASDFGMSAIAREGNNRIAVLSKTPNFNEASCRTRRSTVKLLRKAQVRSQGRGTLQAEPNPSFEARPNGIALGPRSALVHDALRGPSTIPSVPPQLER